MENLKNPINLTITRIIANSPDGISSEVKLGECFKSLSGSKPTITPECNVQDKTFDTLSGFSVREFIVTDITTKEVVTITSYYKNENGPESRFLLSPEIAKKYLVTSSNLKESIHSIGNLQPTDEQRAYLEKKFNGKTPGYAPLIA